MGKHKRKSHRLHVKQGESTTFGTAKLLRYSALGRAKKIRRLLEADSSGELLRAAVDNSGAGALHQACRYGHVTAATLLLRRHADPCAVDTAGNTPGHLAAMHGHVVLLSELIKRAHPQINLDLPNNAGLSIRAILQQQHQHQQHKQQHSTSAGQACSEDSSRETPIRPGSSPANSDGGGQRSIEGGSSGLGPAAAAEATAAKAAATDAEWRAKLADEMSDDDGGWGSVYGESWKAATQPIADNYRQECSTGTYDAAGDAGVDDDAWADRVWQDMQDHKHSLAQRAAAARAASAAHQQGFVGDRSAAAQEKRRRAAAAAEESERILREERAKDSDWRAAMMRQVEEAALPTKRASYEQLWVALDNWPVSKPITYKDIPWPALTAAATSHRAPGPQQRAELHIDVARLRTLVFGGATGPAALKAALRKELMRWHPDKFGARFGSRLAVHDKESILAGVQAVAQQLTALKTV